MSEIRTKQLSKEEVEEVKTSYYKKESLDQLVNKGVNNIYVLREQMKATDSYLNLLNTHLPSDIPTMNWYLDFSTGIITLQ